MSVTVVFINRYLSMILVSIGIATSMLCIQHEESILSDRNWKGSSNAD